MTYDETWLLQQLQKPGYRLVEGAVSAPLARTAPEADLQNRIQALCKATGHLYWHALKSKGSTAGMVDCIIVKEGSSAGDGAILHLWELKRASEDLGPAQRRWHEALSRVTRVDVHVYRPADWPMIVEQLRRECR